MVLDIALDALRFFTVRRWPKFLGDEGFGDVGWLGLRDPLASPGVAWSGSFSSFDHTL